MCVLNSINRTLFTGTHTHMHTHTRTHTHAHTHTHTHTRTHTHAHTQDLPPKKNYIRGISYITGFVIRSNGAGAVVAYLTQSDPRGECAA